MNVSVKESVCVKVIFMRTNPTASTKNPSCSGKAIRQEIIKFTRKTIGIAETAMRN